MFLVLHHRSARLDQGFKPHSFVQLRSLPQCTYLSVHMYSLRDNIFKRLKEKCIASPYACMYVCVCICVYVDE
jgi:hypothetical protein